ncbi:MAG: hypothetical protein ABSG67_01040 [Thermoguttaceae bacterium]|jgi:hypothetical protein
MTPEKLDNLKETYTGRTVMIEALRPELIRWANVPGRVITFNCNGRALVRFEGADEAFYDIDPEYLRPVEPAAEEPAETEEKKHNS